VRIVNISLLAKWRWRFLQNDVALWKEVLVEKYVNHMGELMGGSEI